MHHLFFGYYNIIKQTNLLNGEKCRRILFFFRLLTALQKSTLSNCGYATMHRFFYSQDSMSSFLLIIIYILIGYGIRSFTAASTNLAPHLNKFVIYISLPAMILLQIPKLSFDMNTFIPVIVAWIVMGVSALLVFLTAKYLDFSKNITGSLMLVSVLTNSSFVGIPLITAYLGDRTLPYIIVYDQLGTFLALATYGTFITAYYSHSRQNSVDLKMVVQKVLTFPPFMALVIALILRDISFIPVVEDSLQWLSETIIPFALVAVGLQLQFKLPKDELTPFAVSLLIKLIVAPLIALAICYAFSWSDLTAKVSIMEAGMAPMITAAAMASLVGLAPRLSNAIVGYGILLSFATTWILYRVIELW